MSVVNATESVLAYESMTATDSMAGTAILATPTLLDIPDELFGSVAKYMTLREVRHLRATCRKMARLSPVLAGACSGGTMFLMRRDSSAPDSLLAWAVGGKQGTLPCGRIRVSTSLFAFPFSSFLSQEGNETNASRKQIKREQEAMRRRNQWHQQRRKKWRRGEVRQILQM